MGLRLALKFHNDNDLINAEVNYKRALSQKVSNIVLYQNYGALLRSTGRIDDARSIYHQGLKLFPDALPILSNLANLELKERPTVALRIYLFIFGRKLSNNEEVASIQESLATCIGCMTELGLVFIPFQMLVEYKSIIQFNNVLTLHFLQLLYRPEISTRSADSCHLMSLLVSEIEASISCYSISEQVELRFALASSLMAKYNNEEALKQYNIGYDLATSTHLILNPDDASQLEKTFNVHSWNFANALLKHQNFVKGWALYDYGLLTPANGKQRWQRALPKPFSHNELPLWQGQSLSNKSILLLEEQGVGDAMQFISLIPKLFQVSKHVGLFVSKRLFPIYSRSFKPDIDSHNLSLYILQDAVDGTLSPSSYDFQLPLGSLCQYLFTHPTDYHPRVPILSADNLISESLRQEYLSKFPSAKKVVGISWRGGGNASRIKMKSIDEVSFLKILSNHHDTLFVSLQYGETGSTLQKWKASSPDLNLLFDSRFDAIKNIDYWLNQVNACDAVISVANTTIHAAGGLDIPTQCLLSRSADWRWLDDPSITQSYWYPSIGIARQNNLNSSWQDSIHIVDSWLHNGCPYPSGIFHV